MDNNEKLYYCNCCILEQISYLGKFWLLRCDPKCSWPIRLHDFSINCRTLKLAVSHKESNGINWLFLCPSNSFLRNGLLVFLIFDTMKDNSNIEKLTFFFSRKKFIFAQICAKRVQNGPKICFFLC